MLGLQLPLLGAAGVVVQAELQQGFLELPLANLALVHRAPRLDGCRLLRGLLPGLAHRRCRWVRGGGCGGDGEGRRLQ